MIWRIVELRTAYSTSKDLRYAATSGRTRSLDMLRPSTIVVMYDLTDILLFYFELVEQITSGIYYGKLIYIEHKVGNWITCLRSLFPMVD